MPETLADRIDHAELRRAVRERYGRVATEPEARLGFPVGRAFAEAVGYPSELLDRVPEAVRRFTGVGTPVAVAGLLPGEVVLDLGCGAGLDAVWAAQQVGAEGRVFASDMAPAMVAQAEASARVAGVADRITPLVAQAEWLPLPDSSVDAVLINGIFNLSPDKSLVLREVRRVLKPSGRLAASEVALTRPLEPGEVDSLEDWFR